MAASGFEYIQKWHAARSEKGWWHSFELPDGSRIEGIASLESLRQRLGQFPIADDLRGKRVLDIGCWDGWFSFEMERRGAEVMAIDCWDNPRFRQMHAAYRSKVDYRLIDMYELTPARIGRFDVVLFMGVLYHLKHPLLALERVCALTTDLAAVDSFILREGQRAPEDLRRPILEFYETDEMGGQTDNWFGPSLPALLGMCRTAGFARVELRSVLEFSACVACHRRWENPGGTTAPPLVHAALHMINFGINFRSDRDDYVSAWFDSPLALKLDDVKPEVSGYGVRPLSVFNWQEHIWQVNFKLPPLEKPGWHEVRIRLMDSLPGNPQFDCARFAVRGGQRAVAQRVRRRHLEARGIGYGQRVLYQLLGGGFARKCRFEQCQGHIGGPGVAVVLSGAACRQGIGGAVRAGGGTSGQRQPHRGTAVGPGSAGRDGGRSHGGADSGGCERVKFRLIALKIPRFLLTLSQQNRKL